MTTKMLIQTTEGHKAVNTHNLVSSDPKAVVAHVKRGGLTGGFSITFAVNPETGKVVEFFKKGHLCQRDIKSHLEEGYTEWLFSWAFSGKLFELENGTRVGVDHVVDLVPTREVLKYRGLIG